MPSAARKPRFIRPDAGGFQVDGQRFPWGTTLAALDRALTECGVREDGEIAEIPRGRCGEAYGFPAISFEPAYGEGDRPIRTLTYHLSPYDMALEIADHRWWADAIAAELGAPADEQFADDEERERGGEGTVFYYATWSLDKLDVGLSIFGGQRAETTGIAAGYLYLTWTDDRAAAAPYMAVVRERQVLLDSLAADHVEWQPQTLKHAQYAAQAGDEPEARELERAMSSQPVFDTPPAWACRLKDKQVAHWVTADGRHWGLSTHSDTVFFVRGQVDVGVEWRNVLPNRFDGQMELCVGGMRLLDVHSSKALTAIANAVEASLGRKLDCEISEDNG